MEPGLLWILAGILLLAAELALPGVYLLWVGLAAIGTGAVVLLAVPPFGATVAAFVLLLSLGIGLALRLRRPRPLGAGAPNRPESGLVGRTGTLLPEVAGGLRVRIGDSEWPARLGRDVRVPDAPMRVRVEGVDGLTLLVRPE